MNCEDNINKKYFKMSAFYLVPLLCGGTKPPRFAGD